MKFGRPEMAESVGIREYPGPIEFTFIVIKLPHSVASELETKRIQKNKFR